MENLIFSLNATVPVFAMIILGILFKKIGIIDDVFASKMNKFVFCNKTKRHSLDLRECLLIGIYGTNFL